MHEADDKILEEKIRLENRVTLLEMQVASFEEKRSLMNRLFRSARGCRAAQRTYFNNRTIENLQISKAAERELDGILKELQDGIDKRHMRLAL